MYLKHSLSDDLVRYKGLCFTYKTTQKSSFRYRVVVGIGGNIGDVKRRFVHLFYYLKKQQQVELLQTSSILKNPPFGFLNQDDFFNSLMILQTSMQPKQFMGYLHRVEKKFARKRSFTNAPRSLDLDIIFFDNRVINTTTLQIPHKEWFQRQSVVIPLMDLV